MYHLPVLLHDCIQGLNIKPDGIYVDVTFGGGGHSKEILKHLTTGKLIAFDQDEDAVKNSIDDARFTLVRQNFRFLKNFLRAYNAIPVDGILADLGVSSHQFDSSERGFSIRFDSELDMRMDQNNHLSAASVLNEYEENDLRKILREYGEVDNAGRLAKIICEQRAIQKIKTTAELIVLMQKAGMKPGKENQYKSQVFQALRIEVNKELDALKEFLKQVPEVLGEGGRLVVMSYHSLEDRLVKNFMRTGNLEGEVKKDFYGNLLSPFKQITRKPIVPDEEEIKNNSRARSAKLRIAEKQEKK